MTKPARARRADPHFAREAARYEAPIASREFILETLAQAGVPQTDAELARALGVRRAERDAFARRLAAMEREGQILRNRKGAILIASKLDLIAGRVVGHPDGFGFVACDAGGDDFYLSPREMRRVLHGDRVMVRPAGIDRRGRTEASVVEVTERARQRIVGRFQRERELAFVVPADRRISQEVMVEPLADAGAKNGQIVVVDLTAQPQVDAQDVHRRPIGRVVEIIGNATDPGVEVEIALRKHDLPFEFSAAARLRARRFPPRLRAGEIADRRDLREFPLVTIDGEDARDFDDALWCRKPGEGRDASGTADWRLVVAIADVSHYVHDGDALDLDARERATSVYFPRRVIPMLPERLSNGLCSLNPGEDRLCMVCDMTISPTGRIRAYRFEPAVMRSHARLTYRQVALALAEPDGESGRALSGWLPGLRALEQLYRVLAKARERRGAIDFETLETKFLFAGNRVERIVRTERNDAHRIVEECMLAANVCASDFLKSHGHACLYRIHEGPTPEKLAALREFLKGFGLDLGGGDDPHARDYAKLLAAVRHRPDVQLLQTVMLRSLRQAVYSPEDVGHFGLAYESYTHFTSPIRRYPDLLVHRAIKAVLAGGSYRPGPWADLGEHCSQAERRADDASREVEAWLKCHYMRGRIGEEFDGSISAVTGFGLFVALDDVYVEGLVHVSELGRDYFRFDPVRHELRGERTRIRYRLADRIRVSVARVDLDSARVDLVLAP